MSYEEKFAGLLRMCREAKAKSVGVVMVHHPEVLGDNYIEIVESLNRIADAELQLQIIPQRERGRPS